MRLGWQKVAQPATGYAGAGCNLQHPQRRRSCSPPRNIVCKVYEEYRAQPLVVKQRYVGRCLSVKFLAADLVVRNRFLGHDLALLTALLCIECDTSARKSISPIILV